jgi:hypothetical protein
MFPGLLAPSQKVETKIKTATPSRILCDLIFMGILLSNEILKYRATELGELSYS